MKTRPIRATWVTLAGSLLWLACAGCEPEQTCVAGQPGCGSTRDTADLRQAEVGRFFSTDATRRSMLEAYGLDVHHWVVYERNSLGSLLSFPLVGLSKVVYAFDEADREQFKLGFTASDAMYYEKGSYFDPSHPTRLGQAPGYERAVLRHGWSTATDARSLQQQVFEVLPLTATAEQHDRILQKAVAAAQSYINDALSEQQVGTGEHTYLPPIEETQNDFFASEATQEALAEQFPTIRIWQVRAPRLPFMMSKVIAKDELGSELFRLGYSVRGATRYENRAAGEAIVIDADRQVRVIQGDSEQLQQRVALLSLIFLRDLRDQDPQRLEEARRLLVGTADCGKDYDFLSADQFRRLDRMFVDLAAGAGITVVMAVTFLVPGLNALETPLLVAQIATTVKVAFDLARAVYCSVYEDFFVEPSPTIDQLIDQLSAAS